MLTSLQTMVEQYKQESLTSLPKNHELVILLRQINILASQLFVRDDLAMWFAQRLTQLLFKTSEALAIETYVLLLERVCELSRQVAKELTMWLLFSDDERKYNVVVFAALIQSGLVNVLELDTYLAKQIETGGTQSAEFAVKLIHLCICGETPFLTYIEFFYSLDMIAKMTLRERLPESVHALVDQLKQKCPGPFEHNANAVRMTSAREHMIQVFDEWVQRCQSQMTKEVELKLIAEVRFMICGN
jgi:CCR4-NOT transcription complex subunit 1